MEKVAIIIPARYASIRFPGKILHPIHGKPLVLWVAEAAMRSNIASRVIVATDDRRVEKAVRSAGFEAVMTSREHQSGTDRVWEAVRRCGLDQKWILNLQGDEPLITGEIIDSFLNATRGLSRTGKIEMATMVRRLNPNEAENPNRVKVVTDSEMNALYFSRAKIPYPRNVESAEYWLHVGVYLYRKDILEKFVGLDRGKLEKIEGLEQLRALENGIRISCIETEHEFLGVDSPEDVERVERALKE